MIFILNNIFVYLIISKINFNYKITLKFAAIKYKNIYIKKFVKINFLLILNIYLLVQKRILLCFFREGTKIPIILKARI